MEPDEAPVVLVVGSETETGQAVLRLGSGRQSVTATVAPNNATAAETDAPKLQKLGHFQDIVV